MERPKSPQHGYHILTQDLLGIKDVTPLTQKQPSPNILTVASREKDVGCHGLHISCQWLSLLLSFLSSPSCGSCTGDDKLGVVSVAVRCSRDKPLFGAVTLLKSCEPKSWQSERGKKKECSGISNSRAPSQTADSRHQTGPGKPLFHTPPWLCTEKLSTVYIFIQRRVFLYSDTKNMTSFQRNPFWDRQSHLHCHTHHREALPLFVLKLRVEVIHATQ